MKPLQYYWYNNGITGWLLALVLSPLSLLYCLVVSVRRLLYRSEVLKSVSLDVPVVVIGNIVAGGSGKTPLIIALCDLLRSRGIKVGVVSRGYGGDYQGVRQVHADDPAVLVGDEPLMIARRTGVPVVVSRDRVAAIEHLLDNNICQLVLSDDGLQHYRMRRDLEIAVVDAQQRFGNGLCLPSGPLREMRSRLGDVDIVVENGGDMNEDCAYELMIENCCRLDGEEQKEIKAFTDYSTHAVAGIGHPKRFFDQLKAYDIPLIVHAYADHHRYQQSDFEGWQQERILMTEKDAVKCDRLSLPDAWYVRVAASLSSRLIEELEQKLLPLIDEDAST